MRSQSAQTLSSLESANESISWISGYETEVEVQDAARQIVKYFKMDAFVFGALSRTGEREHHRYLVGCALEWCHAYTQNKWYAIDPFIEYALHNTAPAVASEIRLTSPGQHRMLDAAAEFGYTDGIIVPAHSSSSVWIGILYLATDAGTERVREALRRHRSLMRAFALEMLEWWDVRLRETTVSELELDELDLDLLAKAYEAATAEEAALEIGLPAGRVKWRYERILKKMGVHTKARAVERALELGLLKPRYEPQRAR
jgi:hypothetical protein